MRLFPPFGSESKRVCDVAWGLNGFAQGTRYKWTFPKLRGLIFSEILRYPNGLTFAYPICSWSLHLLDKQATYKCTMATTYAPWQPMGCSSILEAVYRAIWTWLYFDPFETTNVLFLHHIHHRIICIHVHTLLY